MTEQATARVQKLGQRNDKTPAEAMTKAEKAKEKERILQVLGMGLVTDAIRVHNPDPNRRYARVRERDIDIQKFQALGYRIETTQGEGEHGTGDNRNRVGDTILMSVDKDRYELIQEVKGEKAASKIGQGQREYRERSSKAAEKGEAAPPIDLTKGE